MIIQTKRFITVKDSAGKKLFEGEDKRFYNQDYPKCALGISIADWIKGAIYIIGVIVVMSRMQFQVDELVKVSTAFKEYMESADAFNSSVFGTRFRNGAPVDGSYKIKLETYKP